MPDADVSRATTLVPNQIPSYPPRNGEDREALLRFVREAPLAHGFWNGLKSLYKQAEADPGSEPAIIAGIIARIEKGAAGSGHQFSHVDVEGQEVFGCVAHGDYLFVTTGYYYWYAKKVSVFRRDADDPRKAALVHSLDLHSGYGLGVETVVRCGSLLCYVLHSAARTEDKTIQIVDISNPALPRLRGKLSVAGIAAVSDNPETYPYLYLSIAVKPTLLGGKSRLQVVDLSNPDSPSFVGKTDVSGLGNVLEGGLKGTVSVSGTLALFSVPPRKNPEKDPARAGGLRVVDVSNPKEPRQEGILPLETVTFAAAQGSFAYASVQSSDPNQNGLHVVDISEPRAPRSVGFCALTGPVKEISLSPDGRYAYVLTAIAIHTVNISDPLRPVRAGTTDSLGAARLVMTEGNVALAPTQRNGIRLISLTRPETPLPISDAPGGETMGYMKRRGRRFLRRLAKANPARYAEVAAELLLAMTGKDIALDLSRHWATVDVLFGGGTRFRQTKHGRGRYVETGLARSRFALRTREERAPAAWDARPDLLARLLQMPNLLPPVQTFAARALRAAGNELPRLPDDVLGQWLASSEPLLVSLAAKMVTQRQLTGERLPPRTAADAFFASGAAVRQALSQLASGWSGNKRWAEAFATRLAERIAPADRTEFELSKRQMAGALLLSQYFTWAVAPKPRLLLPLIVPFLTAGREELRSLIVAGAGQAPLSHLLAWVEELARVQEPGRREAALKALAGTLTTVAPDRSLLRPLIFHTDLSVRKMGWYLIAASAASSGLLLEIWTELLSSREATPALTTAMASGDALGLLERAGIGATELVTYVSERPFLVSLLSAEAFESVAAVAPASVVLALVAASPDSHWGTLRPIWLRLLREGKGTAAVWLAAENALNSDETGRLEARLLGDEEIVDTFLTVDDERILAIREPGFGSLLSRWFSRHQDRFGRNSALLFDAATHLLPEVRARALARLAELGMDMPFALRLLESAVPPSMEVGRTFFEAEPPGGAREFDYALALCDSPNSDVRRLGIEYVDKRFDTLDNERVLSALFENPAPEIQAFVAYRLSLSGASRPAATPLFDAEVLRTTNRARVAKERIKARQTKEPTVDVDTLLAVAHSRTPRDAEWALAELARRVAAGERIEGISVEGVIGV